MEIRFASRAMIAAAFGPGSAVLMSGLVIMMVRGSGFGVHYLRFQRVPVGESSRMTPRASRPLRT